MTKERIKQIQSKYNKSEKGKARIKKWQTKNIEHLRSYRQEYQRAKKEKRTSYLRSWRADNAPKLREYNKKYYKKRKNNE